MTTTILLIFFAIPLAIIIISIALQKILRNPFLVAGIIFSILLIIVLAFFDTIFLIAVVAYTILAFITALLTCLICRSLNNQICNIICNNCNNGDDNESANSGIITYSNNQNFRNWRKYLYKFEYSELMEILIQHVITIFKIPHLHIVQIMAFQG